MDTEKLILSVVYLPVEKTPLTMEAFSAAKSKPPKVYSSSGRVKKGRILSSSVSRGL